MWALRFWIWLISQSAAIFSDNPFLCKSHGCHGSVCLCACIKLSCVATYHVFLKPNSFFPSFHVLMYEDTSIRVGVCAHACVEFWSQSQESSLSLFHPMLWSLNQFLTGWSWLPACPGDPLSLLSRAGIADMATLHLPGLWGSKLLSSRWQVTLTPELSPQPLKN